MARILVIDDSALMRRMVRRLLEQEGFEVEDWLPLSAMEIPDRILELKPDLVLTDYQMPGLNGQTVARMVQRAAPGLPVVLLSAVRDPEVEGQLQKFGVKAILHKPIDGAALAKALREILGAGPPA